MASVEFEYIQGQEQLSPTKINNNFKKLQKMINSGQIGGSGGGVTGVAVGVEWDVTNQSFTRLESAVGLESGADFNAVYPYSKMRRCNLTDSGLVTAYYGQSAYKDDGTNGQVMVEIPKFYYKTQPVTYTMSNGVVTPTKIRYYIADAPIEGYTLHPAFSRDSEILDYIYLGAYEAVAYDTSASAYVDDFAFDASNDLIGSVKGFKPISGKNATFTRAIARNMARRRGTGWEQLDFLSVSAVQLMMLIEFASFDVQTAVGQGISTKTDDSTSNMAEDTGYTSALGNASGEANTSSSTYKAVSYRGIENLWGNIWTWVDGINIQNNGQGYPWIADHGFADDITTSPYERINGKIPNVNGYIDALIYDGAHDFAMLPASATGASNKPVNDNYWQNVAGAAMTVAMLGGFWVDGSSCGGWCWALDNASSFSHRHIGARVGFYKKTTHSEAALAIDDEDAA